MVFAPLPSFFRPPPDPPPYSLPREALSSAAPPEPPDPPDVVYPFALLRALVTSAKSSLHVPNETLDLKLPCSTMTTKFYGDGDPHVSSGDFSLAYGRLFPVVCNFSPCRLMDWSILRSCHNPHVTVLQVHHRSSLSAYFYYVKWAGLQVVCVILNWWLLVLVVNVSMDRVSVGFFVPLDLKILQDARAWKTARTSVKKSFLPQCVVYSSYSPSLLPTANATRDSSIGNYRIGWLLSIAESFFSHRRFVPSALVAEALAVKAALSAALSSHVSNICLFSDSMNFISLLKTQGLDAVLKGVLYDCVLARLFTSILFIHVLRLANVEADLIAKAALSSSFSSTTL